MNPSKIVIRTEYSKDYRRIPVTAFFLQLTESGFELNAFSDENDFTPQEVPQRNSAYVRRTIETRLIVNPMQAKQLHEILGQNIQTYEQLYGKIPSPLDVQKRATELQTKSQQPTQVSTDSRQSNFGVQ